MADSRQSDTLTRILEVAETLFAQRGYASVRLRDIADAVAMKHASLYYHLPGGKEELFVRVMERSFQRHQQGLTDAIDTADDNLRQQLYAVTDWLVRQPMIDLSRISEGDSPALPASEMQRLMSLAYDALRLPILEAFEAADEVAIHDPDLAAMALVSMAQSVKMIPTDLTTDERQALGHQLVDMLMDGWRTR